MCTKPITITIPATFTDKLQGIYSASKIQLPCGKCPECMKKKQNSIRFRVMNEAKKRGTMDFITLTYDNDSLPISTSLWQVNPSSGELVLVGPCVVQKYVPSDIRDAIINDFDSINHHRMRSYFIRHVFSDYDSEYEYYINYSPSHNYDDVKRLFKIVRRYYERLYGFTADFSYLVVPEFGEHRSRRPHYHVCLFGAPSVFVQLFTRFWSCGAYKLRKSSSILGLSTDSFFTFEQAKNLGFEHFREVFPKKGFINSQRVKAINEDGSDGFAKAASYVGKYIGKGVFEDSLVKDGFVVLPRIGISKHLGELPQSLVDWHLCRDIFGEYDDETLSGLTKNDIDKIVEAVSDRLYHSFQSYNYALPICFRKQIFKSRIASSRNDVPTYLKKVAFSCDTWPDSGKVVYSALYYKVSAFIRDKLLQANEEEFRNYILHYNSKDLSTAVAAFESAKSLALKVREEVAFGRQRKSLQQLIF